MKHIFMIIFTIIFTSALNASSAQKKLDNPSHAVVFMYHHFGVDRFPSTNIKLEQFQKQLNYLDENNYNVWPLSKIIWHIQNRQTIPENTVALTIDDAYISIYTDAFPMLKKKAFPFSVFVNTRPIGKNFVNYMTWEHMREMQRYGTEFANHSSTHAYLIPKKHETQKQWKERLKAEIEQAQMKLQKELGGNTNTYPKLLSYPFGEYTKETAEFIHSLGYIGITQTSGVVGFDTDLKRVPRYAMSETFADMESFILKLNTLPFLVANIEPWDTNVDVNPPRLRINLKEKVENIGCYTSNGVKIPLQWNSEFEFEIQATQPLKGERDRYTCTYENSQGQWHWYSHLWILDDD